MIGPGRSEYDVNVQSQTNSLFQYFLIEEQKTDITLTAPISKDDVVISVSSGHGFVDNIVTTPGQMIVVRSGDLFLQAKVTGVTGDNISISTPVDNPMPIESSVIRGNNLLSVNGASDAVTFKYTTDKNGGIPAIIPIDLNKVEITMQHGSAGDDSTFGDLTIALADSFYFRKVNHENFNFGSYNQNQDFKDMGAKVEHGSKAGSGNHSTNITFDLQDIFTQEVRFNPRTNDMGIGVVRANFSTLLKFTVSLLGSFTVGE